MLKGTKLKNKMHIRRIPRTSILVEVYGNCGRKVWQRDSGCSGVTGAGAVNKETGSRPQKLLNYVRYLNLPHK